MSELPKPQKFGPTKITNHNYGIAGGRFGKSEDGAEVIKGNLTIMLFMLMMSLHKCMFSDTKWYDWLTGLKVWHVLIL